ncbi:MAG: hypothetical protein K1X57_15305, partial [Gemmataceae bacterium]|nr:hypothetical protein [Gemmataceae bacterium]
GRYTLSHWKLEATGLGILMIATLLTPLCFIVLAGLSARRAPGVVDWATEAGAIIVFGILVRSAAQTLCGTGLGTAHAGGWLALGIVGSAASQLVVTRWLSPSEPATATFAAVSLAPPLAQAAALVPLLLTLRRRQIIDQPAAIALLMAAAQCLFAVAVALGFLVYWCDDNRQTLSGLALPAALAGWPLFFTGLLIHRRLVNESPTGESAEVVDRGYTRIFAAAAGGLGLLTILAGLALAWPRAWPLTLVGLGNGILLVTAAAVYRFAPAHIPGIVALAIGSVTGYHLASGSLANPLTGDQLLSLFVSPGGAVALSLTALLLAILSETLIRVRRAAGAEYHAVAAGLLAALACVTLLPAGIALPWRGAWVYGIAGLGAVACNLRWHVPLLSTIGALVALGSAVFLAYVRWPDSGPTRPWLAAMLGHATLFAGSAALALARPGQGPGHWRKVVATPCLDAGMIVSVGALVPLVAGVRELGTVWIAWHALWLASLWIVVAACMTWSVLASAAQAAGAFAVLLFVAHWQSTAVGAEPGPFPYLIALAAYAAGWAMLRWAATRWPRGRQLLDPGWPAFDRILAFSLTLLTLATVWIGGFDSAHREMYWDAVNQRPLIQFDLDGAWFTVGLLAIALAAALWSRQTVGSVLGLSILAGVVPALIAVHCRDDLAGSSAWRWSASLTYAFTGLFLWSRSWLARRMHRRGWASVSPLDAARWSHLALIIVALVPCAVLTAVQADRVISGVNLPGPVPKSLFATINPTYSMAAPLVLLAATLFGHANRERLAGFMFTAGQFLAAAAVLMVALPPWIGARRSPPTLAFETAQVYAAVSGAWALGWLGTGRWRRPRWLDGMALLAFGCVAVLAVVCINVFIVHLDRPMPPWLLQAGRSMGWWAWSLAGAATIGVAAVRAPRKVVHAVALLGITAGPAVVAVLLPFDPLGWLGLQGLTLTLTLTALILLVLSWVGSVVRAVGPGIWQVERRQAAAAAWQAAFPPTASRRWVDVLCIAIVLLSGVGLWSKSNQPIWSVAAVLGVSLLLGGVAVWAGRPGYVYASGFALNLAAYHVWQADLMARWGLREWLPVGPDLTDRMILLQVIALGVGSLAWSVVEWALRRHEPPGDVRGRAMPYCHLAAWLAVHLLAGLIFAALLGDLIGLAIELHRPLMIAALSLIAIAILATLWDPESGCWAMPGPAMYLLGLSTAVWLARPGPLGTREMICRLLLALSGYLALVAVIVRWVPARQWARRWGAPNVEGARMVGWLRTALTATGVVIAGLAFVAVVDQRTIPTRLVSAVGLAVLTGVVTLLGRASDRPLALVLLVSTVAAVVESWVAPESVAPWLTRSARLLLVTTAAAGLLSFRHGAGRRVAGWMTATSIALLGIVLLQELLLYNETLRTTPLPMIEMILVALAVAGGAAASVGIAVSASNPFALGARARSACVWGSELLIVAMLLHLRLNVPDLFPSFLGRYWPLTIMAVSFLGAGLAELFRRRDLPMLAGPLHQTGLFLPLLPLLAYLLQPVANFAGLAESLPGVHPLLRYLDRLAGHHYSMHAGVWFLLGSLYGMVAVFRRAGGYALLAALAGNFGLWVVFAKHEGLAFTLHPQLWMIPLGLIVLGAEWVNRGRLPEAQATGLRYFGLSVIYVSSAADLFITGLGQSVWLPIISACLAVAGALAGILLRVRAYLFLGVTFLALVIFTQIWHAAVNREQTWVWWVSGIVLGIAIITLFALFEKRRDDMERMLAAVRTWR